MKKNIKIKTKFNMVGSEDPFSLYKLYNFFFYLQKIIYFKNKMYGLNFTNCGKKYSEKK